MTTYDYQVLSLIVGLTALVIILLYGLSVVSAVMFTDWVAMPLGWLVGATMVWAYGKFKHPWRSG